MQITSLTCSGQLLSRHADLHDSNSATKLQRSERQFPQINIVAAIREPPYLTKRKALEHTLRRQIKPFAN